MGCDLGRHPVRTVVADDADDIATHESKLEQTEREIAHAPLVIVPGERAPQPEILFAQRNLLAMLAGVQPQQLWIGVGLSDPPGIVHHAALSARLGASSGSTSASSSSPR